MRPNPVTSVSACTAGIVPKAIPGVLSRVVLASIAAYCCGCELSAFQCRAVNADAERLAEHESIARLRARVALEVLRIDEPDDDESVDRFDGIDRVAARDGNAGARAHGFAAVEDAADRLDRQFVDGHPDERQREERRTAHRVHVGDGVGRGDHAEVVRVIDDRHEEVRRRYDGLPFVQLKDRRVVRGLDADEQFLRDQARSGVAEDLPQHGRRDLASAPAAMAELGQAKRGAVGSVHRNPGVEDKESGAGAGGQTVIKGLEPHAFYRHVRRWMPCRKTTIFASKSDQTRELLSSGEV